MDQVWWAQYVIWGIGISCAFFAVSIWFLIWSLRKGHFSHLHEQAGSIFDDEEPEGVITDSFPSKS